MKRREERKNIDWMITLVPLGLVVALSVLFFFLPEQSNQVLGRIRFFFGDTLLTIGDEKLWHLPNTYTINRSAGGKSYEAYYRLGEKVLNNIKEYISKH